MSSFIGAVHCGIGFCYAPYAVLKMGFADMWRVVGIFVVYMWCLYANYFLFPKFLRSNGGPYVPLPLKWVTVFCSQKPDDIRKKNEHFNILRRMKMLK